MIAKIIQNQYMAGTYIVSKYDDSKFKNLQIIHQNQKLEFFTIILFPWKRQPFFMVLDPPAPRNFLFHLIVNYH